MAQGLRNGLTTRELERIERELGTGARSDRVAAARKHQARLKRELSVLHRHQDSAREEWQRRTAVAGNGYWKASD